MKLISTNVFLVFLLSVLLFSACSYKSMQYVFGSPTPTNSREEQFAEEWKSRYEETAAELEHNRRLWQESKIVNYDFICEKLALGTTNEWNRLPVLIKIREGEKVSIEKVEKDKDYIIYSRTDGFEDFDTIEKLFSYLRQELDNGRILNSISYDKNLGYPTQVTILPSREMHAGRSIQISKFEAIK